MSAALPSQPAPSPRGHPLPVEALQEQLGGLLRERELLRAAGNELALERNRRDIGICQRDLSAALIALYCPN
jgi:hypothetical protein